MLNKTLNHIFRKSGNYPFEIKIEVIKSLKSDTLMKIGNRKTINRNLTQLKSRLKTHEKQLGMLDPSQASENKFKTKLSSIERTKEKIAQLEAQRAHTTKGNEKKYREVILSLTNVPNDLKKNDQFLALFKSVAIQFMHEMKLGNVIAAAQHKDQFSPHCHFIIDSEGSFSKRMKEVDKYAGMQRKWNAYVKKHMPEYDWKNISDDKIDYLNINLLKKVDKELESEIANTHEKDFKQKFIQALYTFKRPAQINRRVLDFAQQLKDMVIMLKTELSEKNDQLKKTYALYQHQKKQSEDKDQKIDEQQKKIELRDRQLAKALGRSFEKNDYEPDFQSRRR